MKQKLLLILVGILCSLGTWADAVTLFTTNFSTDDGWSTESIITSSTTTATKTIKGTTISFKGYKSSDLTVAVGSTSSADGTLTFTGNNLSASKGDASGANYYMAIPVTGVNEEITVTTTGDATKWYYTYDDGSVGSVIARQQATANGGFTITGLTKSNVTIYIGTNAKKLNSITITTPAATVAHTVTFSAGSNGTCSTTSLTEASAGAGVTLPSATASDGYTFSGWATTEGATTADAGAAGATYSPSADITLYAVYTSSAAGSSTIKTVDGTTTTWDFTAVTQAMCANLSTNWTEVEDGKYFKSSASGGDESPAFMEGLTVNTCGSDKSRVYYDGNTGYCFNGSSAYIIIPVSEGQTLEIYSEQDIVSSTSSVTLTSATTGVWSALIPSGVTSVKIKRYSGATYITKIVTKVSTAAATPIISATLGSTYGSVTTVAITSSTADATIYYTTDGTTPNTSSSVYSEAFTVSTACTIKAIAVKTGLENSSVASSDVTINNLRKITYNFSGITLTQGTAPAAETSANDASYTLPKGRLYYIDGKTQTGWNDGTKTYALGESVTINKDYTFTPVFVDNTVGISTAKSETTVNWTFASNDGAPSAKIESAIGYYACQATVDGTALDIIMKIDASSGKWDNLSRTNCAQVNAGTKFTIPAVKDMSVTYTIVSGTATAGNVTFAGENGTASGTTYTYTYTGTETTLEIIDVKGNGYPSGITVVYPSQTAKYDVTYVASSAATGTMEGTTASENDKITLPTPTFTANDGIGFTGWKCSIDNNIYAAGAEYTMTAAATTFTAQYATVTGSIIKATLTGGTAATVEGSLAGSADVKVQSDCKFGNGHYAGLTLASGQTFHTGDVLNINITKVSSGGGSIILYTTKDRTDIIYDTHVLGQVGNNYIALPEAINEKTTFYIGRTGDNGWNATVTNIEVIRPTETTTTTLGTNAYSTFCAEYPFAVGGGAKAYKATYNASKSQVTLTEVNTVIPAGEGVILLGSAEGNSVNISKMETGTDIEDNDLIGVTSATISYATGSNYYLASKKNDDDTYTTSFVKFESSYAISNLVNKAYLNVPSTNEAKSISIVFDGEETTTGISQIATVTSQNSSAYNLAGQRINANAKGIIIINGKKYFNK